MDSSGHTHAYRHRRASTRPTQSANCSPGCHRRGYRRSFSKGPSPTALPRQITSLYRFNRRTVCSPLGKPSFPEEHACWSGNSSALVSRGLLLEAPSSPLRNCSCSRSNLFVRHGRLCRQRVHLLSACLVLPVLELVASIFLPRCGCPFFRSTSSRSGY